ncbi:MAG: hypothetical protein FJ087_16325 [Deltaproteobacteria bacterium]|nr:hypothetical protein [Deltaproteobacteria bacterium]
MAHEFGHHWMASVTFDRGDGAGPHCALRGYQFSGPLPPKLCDGGAPAGFNQHWSYWFDSGGVMYGNRIEDLGGGRFRTRNDGLKYGPLDQYLMGIRAAEEVGPLFLVDVGTLQGSGAFPAAGGADEVFQGARVDFTVEDVIRAVGPRKPFPDRCHWKAAVVAVHPKGKPPTAAQLDKLVRYANGFEAFYAKATDGRGSIDLTIDGRGEGTAGCPADGVAPAPDTVAEPVPGDDAAPVPDFASDAAGEVAPDNAGQGGSVGCGAGTVPVPVSMLACALAGLAAIAYRRAQRPIQ